MKKMKAILALVLVAALVCALFAACAKDTTTPTGTDKPATTEPAKTDTPAKTDEPAKTEEPEKTDEPEEPEEPETYDPEDYTDIKMFYFDLRMVGADHGERINKAINDYIGPKYGLQVGITYFNVGDWLQKVQLSISGGEQVDVLPLCVGNGLTTMLNNKMLIDIAPYMAEEGQETLELMKNYIPTYMRGDALYGIPTYRGYCTNSYIIMRKDILEELGMVELAENMQGWSDYETILGAVADKYTAETGLWALSKGPARSCTPGYLWNGDKFTDRVQWDSIGDGYGQVYTDPEGNVSWVLEDPRFTAKLEMVKRWRDNGWIWPDSSLNDTHGDELIKQGVSFSDMDGSEYGVEAVKSANCGHPLICFMYGPGWIMTSTLHSWGIGVPVTAEEPEMGCRFINALYTDDYLMNLLTRGEEGVDFNVVNGEVVYKEESHYYEADFLIGNNTLLYPLEGQGADYFDQIKKINDEAHISEYLGFVLNTADMTDMIANISAVYDQYSGDLYCGNYTPELFAEYKGKLETAGVHDYLDEIQRQVTAWKNEQ